MPFFKRPEKSEAQCTENDRNLTELREEIEKKRLPEPVAAIVMKELERLEKTDTSVPEYAIGLNYIEFVLSLPWDHTVENNLDMKRAETTLESQHHALNPVKERILEYLAVRTLCRLREFYILVVDDEPIARANLEYVLKKEGYRIETAANGAEALDLVKKHTFDLILTDMKMEKMDGIALLEAVRKISPRTDIILITGYATVNTAVDALQKGAAHYLPKPINLDHLREIVRSIQQRKNHLQLTRSPILCFTGPPGTGKTSIGRSIADALDRPFVRISLAGLRDEADLRGHRRTYVGAMAGRIISEIRRVGKSNPVFMLDEIDKIGQDFRGDPASVLLEILDPEQNSHFIDHYLDLPFDLSSVLFITTANGVDGLPAALRDRLETIVFTGYTEREKHDIALNFIIPRQLREHALLNRGISFTDGAVYRLIRDYTRESGLRNLEREVAAVCRKLARLCLSDESVESSIEVDEAMVERFLGPRRFTHEIRSNGSRVGVVTGLAWTEFGGEIISVEAGIMRGTQQLILTGSLGEVLRESAQTALSYVRSHAESLGIDPDFYRNSDIHVHIPSGAVPKDGTSAGVTIAMSIVSLLSGRPAKRDVALTGELTLSGGILAVAGIREKLLAAQRAAIQTVIFPEANRTDIDVLDADTREGVEIVLADQVDRLVDVALEKGR